MPSRLVSTRPAAVKTIAASTLVEPFDVVITPRQSAFASGRNVYYGYVLGRDGRDAAEPDVLVRVVLVRDDERDVDAAREQHLQAAHADVVICEDDCARLHCVAPVRFAPAGTAGTPSCCSSTAWIR